MNQPPTVISEEAKSAAESERERLQAESAALKQGYDEENKTVTRIWELFGNPSYESLNGKSIVDLVQELQAENAKLKEETSHDIEHIDMLAKIHIDEVVKARDLQQQLSQAQQMVLEMREALESVVAHRHEDRDGNHVMWIGETTFMLCQSALKLTTPLTNSYIKREEFEKVVET